MSPLRTFLILALVTVWAASAMAQPDFRAYPSTENATEGGNVNIMVIQTEQERFQLRIPKGYGAQVHQNDESIVFTSQSGTSIITVKMSTNYARALPKMEILRDDVAKKYSTASLVQTSSCYTACGAGLLFDLFQPASGNLTMHIRDGFVSVPEGSFEFTLSCDSRDFDSNKLSFAWLINSFRLQQSSATTNP